MEDAGTFPFKDVNLEELANTIKAWFDEDEFETQYITEADGAVHVVQARKESLLRSLTASSFALEVRLSPMDEGFKAQVGQGKWADRYAAAIIGAVLFAPALLVAGYGVLKQNQLSEKVAELIVEYLTEKGFIVPEKLTCVACAVEIPEQTQFCPECGHDQKQPVVKCAKCEVLLAPDAGFCGECGTKVAAADSTPEPVVAGPPTCSGCSQELPAGANFCGNCGTKAAS